MHNKIDLAQETLRAAGLRVTSARRALLQLLEAESQPIDVQTIVRTFPQTVDQATIYRIMSILVAAGLVREVALRPGVVHYESARGPHHHHVVCERCGLVEDVTECRVPHRPQTASFAEVTRHSLEFSGICKQCVKA